MLRRKRADRDIFVSLEKPCPECGEKLPVDELEIHKPVKITCPECQRVYMATRHGDSIVLEEA